MSEETGLKNEVGEYWIWLGYDDIGMFHARRSETGGMVLIGGSQRPFNADQVELLVKFLQGQLPILRSLEAGHTYHGENPQLPITLQSGDTVTFESTYKYPYYDSDEVKNADS